MKPPPPPTSSQYHLESFNWDRVARVLVLPVHNESSYNHAGFEVRQALGAELQRLGRFEVVSPPSDHPAFQSEFIHIQGRFDEAEMLDLARTFAADLVIHTTITQYMPYGRARLGIVVQAVSPFDAKVVASVDGLWDTASIDTVRRARAFYHTPIDARGPVMAKIKEALSAPTEDGRADELAIESPALFQRFVCSELVHYLVVLPDDDLAHSMRGFQHAGLSPIPNPGNCAPCPNACSGSTACPAPTAPSQIPATPQSPIAEQNPTSPPPTDAKTPPARP